MINRYQLLKPVGLYVWDCKVVSSSSFRSISNVASTVMKHALCHQHSFFLYSYEIVKHLRQCHFVIRITVAASVMQMACT